MERRLGLQDIKNDTVVDFLCSMSHISQTGGASNLESPTCINRQRETPGFCGQRTRKGTAQQGLGSETFTQWCHRACSAPSSSRSRDTGTAHRWGGGDQRTVQGPVHPQVYYSSISHTMWPKEVPSNPSCSTRRHPVEAQVELED